MGKKKEKKPAKKRAKFAHCKGCGGKGFDDGIKCSECKGKGKIKK